MESGVFVVDKPVGVSTNGLIQKIKHRLGIKKIGHAGTLDPLASGVVLVLVNQATKLSDYLMSEDKAYVVKIKLFSATSTYDAEGEVTATQPPFEISKTALNRVIKKYQGLTYAQEPPIYSAIKVKGQKLYQYALNQQTVKIEPRMVTIKKMELLEFDSPYLTLKVQCSKGTYIRSLAVDLAADLKTLGYVKKLERISSGNFDLTMAKKWDQVNVEDLISMAEGLKMANQTIVEVDNPTPIELGQAVELKNLAVDEVFLANHEGEILAVYARSNKDWFKCKRGGMNLK